MKKFLKKVLKNKKEIFTIALFFFLSFSIPLTGYFVTSERSFDERSEANATFTFTASPSTIAKGQPSTLSWKTTGYHNCVASGGWNGSKSPSDSLSVTPQITTIYSLACEKTEIWAYTSVSKVTRSVTVTVNTTSTPPLSEGTVVVITSFSISPSTQVQGGSVTISGKMENATSCNMSQGGETKPLKDTELKSFSYSLAVTKSPGTYTYKLACTGGGGDAEKTATLTVNDATSPPPTPPPPSGGSCSSLGGTCRWTYIISGSRCTTGGKTGTVKMGLCPNDEGCCVPNTTTPPPPPPPSPTVKYSRSSNVCGADGRYPCVEDANGSYTTLSNCQSSCTPPTSPPPPPPPLGECTTNLDCRRQAPFEICFENSCLRGDVLNNSLVNMLDFSQFKKDFVIFKQSGWSEALRKSDFNLDGRISMADYSVFVRSYRLVNRLD